MVGIWEEALALYFFVAGTFWTMNGKEWKRRICFLVIGMVRGIGIVLSSFAADYEFLLQLTTDMNDVRHSSMVV